MRSHISLYSLLAGLSSLVSFAKADTTWSLSETYGANDFFDGFTWFTDTDPTDGLVLYQSMADAQSANLSVVSKNQFIMAVETTEVALEGRKSVRISSNKNYADGIYV